MNRNADNKEDKFQFIELFLVAADVNRTFVATRLRKKDHGQEFVTASVKIVEGEVVSAAVNEELVEENLDEICKMKLDFGLHKADGKSSVIFHYDFFHN